jgi:hypothetical protein
MVSEPTPVASFSAGELAAVTLTAFVADEPPAVTLTVYEVVLGVVHMPSTRAVQLFVPPVPSVAVLGRAGVMDQVHFAVVGVAASWNPVGMPTTMPALAGPVIARALRVAGCAWAVAVRPSVPSVAAAVAAATTSLRMLRALSYRG